MTTVTEKESGYFMKEFSEKLQKWPISGRFPIDIRLKIVYCS